MKLMVVIGSVRQNRRADVVGSWALAQLQKNDQLAIDKADLRDVNLPLFDEAIIPSDNQGRYQNPVGQAWAERVAAAEAYIFITSEYNYGPPAALKNAVDWVYDGWRGKPVGFIGYGGISGGIRAVMQLKQNVMNVNLWPINRSVQIPFIAKAFDESGQPVSDQLNISLEGMLGELTVMQRKLSAD